MIKEYIYLLKAGMALFSATVLMNKPDPDVRLVGTVSLIGNLLSLFGRE